MASNAIHEMIAAYSAGCIDKKNLQNFREYMESGGDMPVGELGELQNVISLLPVILELEKPSPNLKDKVAKKLIGLQDEIKEKIKITKQRTAATRSTEVPPPPPHKSIVEEVPPEESRSTQTGAFDKVEPTEERMEFTTPEELTKEKTKATTFEDIAPQQTRRTEFRSTGPQPDEPPTPTKRYDLPPRTVDDLESGKARKPILIWIAIGLVFAILLAGLIIVYNSSAGYKSQIASLEQRVASLQNEIDKNRGLINKYEDLNRFMNYGDLKVIPLSPIDENTSGSGKLMMSFEHREGLLELNDMPTLGTNQAFQVWLISEGRSFSLGSFVPNMQQKFIEIDDIPYIPKNEIELVRVTIEPLSGSDLPQGPAVLFGAVNGD